MKKERLYWTLIGLVLIVVVALAAVSMVDAQSILPEDVQVFYADDLTCIVWPDGSGDCYCPCEAARCGEESTPPAPPTDIPPPTETPTPTETPPPPPPTPTKPPPKPTKKPRCNKGEGNQGEDCDPGRNPDLGNDDED